MKSRSSATGPDEHKDRVSEPDAPGSDFLIKRQIENVNMRSTKHDIDQQGS